jgi:hypothetical protein
VIIAKCRNWKKKKMVDAINICKTLKRPETHFASHRLLLDYG